MPKTHPPHSPEFRRQIVDLVRTGRDPADLAREFEPTAQAIRNWVVPARRNAQRLRLSRPGFRVHEREPGHVPDRRHGPCSRRVGGRLLRLAAPPSVCPRPGGRSAAEAGADIHASSRETYGAPRVHAALRADGGRHGRKRVARLMRAAGLVGASRRRAGVTTTKRDKEARPAPDLVDRDFTATAPNQLWVADITSVPTTAGFLYLAVVLDAWSRKIVGWSMANHLRAELVVDALEMALGQRQPHNVIV